MLYPLSYEGGGGACLSAETRRASVENAARRAAGY